jgi:hypothetical protein
MDHDKRSRLSRPLGAVMMAALLYAPLVAHAQDQQAAAEIASSGVEIPQADCKADPEASRSWAVITDATASSGTALEHTRTASTEKPDALAVCRSLVLENGDISLRFKALAGANEVGGLALRMVTPNDYYLVKIDALRDRALLLLVRNGAAEEIVGVDADVATEAWHTLAVRVQDDQFTVYLDGIWIFTGFDKTLSRGRIALWAEPGSTTRFDRITMGSVPKSPLWRR